MLGKSLKLLRVYHQMTQQQVAEVLNVSKPYVSEIETEKKQPSLQVVEAYAAAFDIPLSSLLFFAENLESNPDLKKAKGIISRKIIKLLEFISEKANLEHG